MVTDNPYFDEGSNVRYVLVDGTLHEYEVKKKKKAGSQAEGEPIKVGGKWSYVISTEEMGDIPGLLELNMNNSEVSGKISNQMSQGQSMDLSGISLDGNRLSFSHPFQMDGNSIQLIYELEFDGESFEGMVSVPGIGSFDISGEKQPD